MLEKEFQYFKENQKDLYQKYPDKFLVIQGQKVVIVADTMDQAYTQAIDGGYKLGEFLIQECLQGEDAYTEVFHSRVIYA